MYDLVTLAILAGTTIHGAMKGIVWQLAAIGSVVLCFLCATPLSLILAPLIPIGEPLNRWTAMLVIYLGCSFVAFAAARQLRRWLERAKFEEYDRHVGGVFGFIKGVAFSLVLTFFVVTMSESARGHILESHSGYAAAVIMDGLHPVMPAGLHEVLEPYIHRLDRPEMNLEHGHHSEPGVPQAHHSATPPEQGSTASIPAFDDSELQPLLGTLPAIFDAELRELILQALRRTAAADRPELLGKLSSGIPGLMRAVATEWQHGRPPQKGTDEEAEHAALLREIGGVYSDFLPAQAAIVEEILAALVGLPSGLEIAVLRDWHSDLLMHEPDPDPVTDQTTPLDSRILRQLSLARIRLGDLTPALQARLRESLPR